MKSEFPYNILKTVFRYNLPIVIVIEIIYLSLNFVFYLQKSEYYTQPYWAILILIVFLFFSNIKNISKKDFTKNEKLIAGILYFFILKTKEIKPDEKEKVAEILEKIFTKHSLDTIIKFLHEYDISDENNIYSKYSEKDFVYKNILLKYLFRTALDGRYVSLYSENQILYVAAKVKIGKSLFDRRKFFCVKAGYSFESLGSKAKNGDFFSDFEYEKACKILGIASDSSFDEVKKAKRILAKKFHPDKTGIDSEKNIQKFIEITESYVIIKKYRKFK